MSLLSQLNSIISYRRLAEDLAGNEPQVPPAPAGYASARPKRAKGTGASFAQVDLYPTPPMYLNQVSPTTNTWYPTSQTNVQGFAGVPTPPPQTTLDGPELASSGGASIYSPNPYTIVTN